MAAKVAIIQSSYIPWKGYFNIIRNVDVFVLLDDVQFTRRDWRNRNLIKTKQGLKWLTIPVNAKGNFHANINEMTAHNSEWRDEHWNAIESNYRHLSNFSFAADALKQKYLAEAETQLSMINHGFILLINSLLGINTPVKFSHELGKFSDDKTGRLVDICKKLGASEYISGPAARDYLDVSQFHDCAIQVRWANYSDYPTYDQIYPPFEHGVSILDLLFHEGRNSDKFFKTQLWE